MNPKRWSGAILAGLADERGHFAEGLLLGHVADAAGIEEDDIRDVLGGGEGIALGDELSGDGFAVAFIHLAAVRFDVNTRHVARVARRYARAGGKGSGK